MREVLPAHVWESSHLIQLLLGWAYRKNREPGDKKGPLLGATGRHVQFHTKDLLLMARVIQLQDSGRPSHGRYGT